MPTKRRFQHAQLWAHLLRCLCGAEVPSFVVTAAEATLFLLWFCYRFVISSDYEAARVP
jgi:hypothetical protein